MARPRFMRPVGRIGSSVEAIAIVCKEQRLRDHEEFVRTHDTTVNVVVTEETRIINAFERTRIQCTLQLRARVFGEWKTFPNTQEMIDQLNAADILWELRLQNTINNQFLKRNTVVSTSRTSKTIKTNGN